MPWFLGNSRPFMDTWAWNMGVGWGLIPLAVWSVLWTGIALWHAARREEKGWFVFFLLVHTLGIAEILYLVFVAHAFGKEKKRRSR